MWTSEAALRNGEPIRAALAGILPERGCVLEIGSGTGEHAVLLARAFPGLQWRPSDPDPDARAAIEERAAEARLPNLLPPLHYDLRVQIWRMQPVDAVLCINVLHVAPPECLEALCEGASRILPAGGPLVVFGPFAHRASERGGRLARLDAMLRDAEPAHGVREVEALAEAGRRNGLRLTAEIAMPQDGDLLLVLRNRGS